MRSLSLVFLLFSAALAVSGGSIATPSKVSFNADNADGIYVIKDKSASGPPEINCFTVSNFNFSPSLSLFCELFREFNMKLRNSNAYNGEKYALLLYVDQPEIDNHFGLNSYLKRSLDSIGGGHLIRRSVI